MTEFDKTRREIEEIKKAAEAKRLAEEQSRLTEEEEKRRESQEAQGKEQAREKALGVIKAQTPELLQAVNSELFNGKAVVIPWQKNKRILSKLRSEWDEYTRVHWTERHQVTQEESHLKIPGIGEVIVGIPLAVSTYSEYKKAWSEPERTSSLEGVYIMYMREGEKEIKRTRWVSLDTPHDQLPEVLTHHILETTASLHREAFGL